MKAKSNLSRIMDRKRKTLALFSQIVLSSPIEKYIGRIALFGSLRKNEIRADSDVDVLIVALDKLREVEAACDSLKAERPRLAVDAGYNAAELCVKGYCY